MYITWHGQTLFSLTSQEKNTDPVQIIIDPFDKSVGLRIPKMEADVLLLTHKNEIDQSSVGKNPFLIDMPGEYEIKNAFVRGIDCVDENIVYTIEMDGIKLCHLGALSEKELSSDQIEKIGYVDILMVPIGGVNTINPQEAIKIINQIEPRIVVPMNYQIPKLNKKLETKEKFLKAIGADAPELLKKLSIKKKDLPAEMKIIILES